MSNLHFGLIAEGWDGIGLVVDTQGKIIAMNSDCQRFFALEDKSYLSDCAERELFASKFQLTSNDFNVTDFSKVHAFSKGEKLVNKVCFKDYNGQLISFKHKQFGLKDENDNLLAIASIYCPIAPAPKYEFQIDNLAKVFDNSLFDVFVFEAQTWNFTYLNKSAFKNIGYSKSEIKELSPLELIDTSAEYEFKSALDALRSNSEKMLVFEVNLFRKDRSFYRTEIQLQYLPFETSPSFLAIVQNIEARYRDQENIRKLNNAVEYSPSAAVITDKNGIIEYVNPRFEKITGYTKSEVIGKNPRVLKSGKQTKFFYKQLWETISNGELWEGEFHNRKKSGELYWERASIGPIFNKRGDVTHFIALKEDITTQKLTSEALQKSEHIYRTLVKQLPNSGVFLFNKELEYILAEGPIIEQVNRKVEDFVGKPVVNTLHPQFMDDSLTKYKKALKGEPSYYETQVGEKYYKISIVPLIKESGEVFLGMMAILDVTDQKKVENEVRSNFHFLQTIIQTIPDPFFYQDLNGVYLNCNEAFAHLFDMERTTIVGRKVKDLLSENQQKTLNKKNKQLFAGKESCVYESTIQTRSNKKKHLLVNKAVVKDHKGEVVGVLGILHDITLRRNYQIKLKENNRKLTELNNEKDSIMSIVAHDLKSPLNKVQGLANVIRLDANLTADQIKYLDLINGVTENSQLLIRDLLDINTYEQKDTKVNYSVINISELLEEQVVAYNQFASNKEIKVEYVGDRGIKCITDQELLFRITDNLLSNAIKFSFPYSTVRVRCVKTEELLEVSVMDEGPGISREDQKKMFKRFQKLTAQPTGGESSTGLGLSIIQVLVDKLKGDISVESKLQEGTTFTISLPNGEIG